MKHIIRLANETHRATIEVDLLESPCDVAPYLTIDGEPVGDTYTELSICANISEFTSSGFWREYSIGQCADSVRTLFKDVTGVSELCDLWDRWHLNDLTAGTRAQQEALRLPDFDPKAVEYRGIPDHYASACKYLETRGLNPDPAVVIGEGTHMKPGPYMYGHAWLVDKIPAEVEKRIEELCKLLETT